MKSSANNETFSKVKKEIYVFLFDGYSDWEISFLTPEINRSEKFGLVYFSKNGNVITSMGGLQVKPTTSLNNIKAEEVDFLILPGGTTWDKGENKEIEHLTLELFETGKSIAAICAATSFLGQLGILNNLKHTSNDLGYLKAIATNYCGDQNYLNSLAVTDKNIITAKGIAPIEFAREVFRKTELKSDDEIEKWFQLFKNGIWSE
ncbi:MAG: glutamine amidotransferase [Candidatus Cloacimonetes bacterium]|nr:glutamine amidotransferase [Candidatus Cloacimonadota bacterium]